MRKCEYCHEAVEVTPGTTGYDVMRQIKTLLAERPAYQYFRICLQGYKDPDVIDRKSVVKGKSEDLGGRRNIKKKKKKQEKKEKK